MKNVKIKMWILVLAGIGIICSGNVEKPVPAIATPAEKTEKTGVTLISVFDNYQIDTTLKTSWGFGCLVQTETEIILFDTGGDPDILLFNMAGLGIDPGSVDKVVISHIHGDHLGGLDGFLEKNSDVTVFIPASLPDEFRQMIKAHGSRFVEVSEAVKISDFVYTTGELYGPPNEQSLIINSKKGLIVITGCAHPGIVNIVKRATELMKEDGVYLVMGGFHHPPLAVIKEFRELGVKKVAPSHCTGDPVRNGFAEEYQRDYIAWGVGKRLVIDGPAEEPELEEQ